MTTISTPWAGVVAAVLFSWFAVVTSAKAVECPQNKMLQSLPVRMSPAELTALGNRLVDAPDGNVVEEFAVRMRSKLPDIATSDLVNALVSVYCEALAARGESGPAATAKLGTFAGAAYDRLVQ